MSLLNTFRNRCTIYVHLLQSQLFGICFWNYFSQSANHGISLLNPFRNRCTICVHLLHSQQFWISVWDHLCQPTNHWISLLFHCSTHFVTDVRFTYTCYRVSYATFANQQFIGFHCSARFVTGVRFTYTCYGVNNLEFLFKNTFADQQITEIRHFLVLVAAGLPCNCFWNLV